MVCHKCGSYVNDSDTHCPVCNSPVDTDTYTKDYSTYKPPVNIKGIIISIVLAVIAVVVFINIQSYQNKELNYYKGKPEYLASDVYTQANQYYVNCVAAGKKIQKITINDLVNEGLITHYVPYDVKIITDDNGVVQSVIVDGSYTYTGPQVSSDLYSSEPNSDDSASATVTVENDDFDFLKSSAVYSEVNVETYSGFSPSDDYCNDPEQIEYDLYTAPTQSRREMYNDENYYVFNQSKIYVCDKSKDSENPQQSISFYESSLASKGLYLGDYLYLCFDNTNEISHDKTSPSKKDSVELTDILVVEKDNLTVLGNAVFSDNYRYMAYLNSGNTLYVIDTETFRMEKISDIVASSSLTISNNGTVMYYSKSTDSMYIKYLNNPKLYRLESDYKPIYINNENQSLFVETNVGIKKISESGEDMIFKYAGFSSNPGVSVSINKGVISSTITVIDKRENAEQVLNLLDY